MDSGDNPNIFITSPTTTNRFQQPLSLNMSSMHTVHSPGSSPTQGEIPLHPRSLSRQQSFQHVTYRNDQSGSTPVTPLPPSPASGSMELYDDAAPDNMGRSGVKRQRTSSIGQGDMPQSVSTPGPKKLSRARSDSAPLGGYGLGMGLNGWQGGTRPRSGSGMMVPRSGMGGVPSRSGGPPLLSISTATSNSPR
jgi:hypothetical protein